MKIFDVCQKIGNAVWVVVCSTVAGATTTCAGVYSGIKFGSGKAAMDGMQYLWLRQILKDIEKAKENAD